MWGRDIEKERQRERYLDMEYWQRLKMCRRTKIEKKNRKFAHDTFDTCNGALMPNRATVIKIHSEYICSIHARPQHCSQSQTCRCVYSIHQNNNSNNMGKITTKAVKWERQRGKMKGNVHRVITTIIHNNSNDKLLLLLFR